MKKLITLVIVAEALMGCQSMDNHITKITKSAAGSCFKVSLFSGGKEVKRYYTDYVSSEKNSDGWFFEDKKGRLITLSGNIAIEEVNEKFCSEK
ncbi:hypothetical protein [Persephonella sp. KM09-Lau-8]|uniref:hypothetical protein n=1 Tax=Persephonella sp. KM09-Lau-8 TaxID=1158345 RepID=UPI00049803FC|nr:hypothetical protein [Persephonella sp. KM09-Lau-8]